MNNDKDYCDISLPLIFKYEGQKYFLIAIIIIFMFFSFLCFVGEESRHGSIKFVEIIFFGIPLLFLLFFVLIFRGQSDILINGSGIAKSFFGWKWSTIRWDNIKAIKVMPYFDRISNKTVQILVIYPTIPSRFRVVPSGQMDFTDRINNSDELIKALNYFVSTYEIKVEYRENDKLKLVSQIQNNIS